MSLAAGDRNRIVRGAALTAAPSLGSSSHFGTSFATSRAAVCVRSTAKQYENGRYDQPNVCERRLRAVRPLA